MMTIRCWNMLAALSLGVMSLAAHADIFTVVDSQPREELWLNPGFYAWHFQRDLNLNNDAFGFGAEYRYSTVGALTAGVYHNSNWHTSHYAAYYWRPIMVGKVRLGVIAGAVDGYPGTRKGGWFPAALPAASVEYGRVGLNILYIPSIQGVVNGSITFQLNLKIF